MTLRTKIILNSVLLILALVGTFFAAKAAMGAIATFQHQNALTRTGDVRTIRPWMTIPYIAHEYHVPDRYLYEALNITSNYPVHSTLQAIAIQAHHPASELIHKLQMAIMAYRKQHPFHPQYQQHPPGHSPPNKPVRAGGMVN